MACELIAAAAQAHHQNSIIVADCMHAWTVGVELQVSLTFRGRTSSSLGSHAQHMIHILWHGCYLLGA